MRCAIGSSSIGPVDAPDPYLIPGDRRRGAAAATTRRASLAAGGRSGGIIIPLTCRFWFNLSRVPQKARPSNSRFRLPFESNLVRSESSGDFSGSNGVYPGKWHDPRKPYLMCALLLTDP